MGKNVWTEVMGICSIAGDFPCPTGPAL